MDKERREKLDLEGLRRRAETFLDGQGSVPADSLPADVRDLVQELRIAQVELEIQNEDLLATQSLLEENRRRWQAFFDQAPVGYLVADRNGAVRLANETFCQMVGLSHDQIRRRFLSNLISAPDRYEKASEFLSQLSTARPSNMETRISHEKTGRSIDVRLEGRLTSTPQGDGSEDLTVLVTVTDVTESRTLRTQLFETQKLESVGRLAGGIAHDFNNSLMIIQGTVDVIRSGETMDAEDAENLLEIDRAVDRGAGLVRQLLEFANKGDAAPRVIAVGDVLVANETMLRRMIPENIDLRYKVPEDLFPILMDPVQLDQVLVNLVLNARDAIEGNGNIRIVCRNVRLGEEDCSSNPLARPGQFVEIAVMDDGRGMNEEVRNQVFEPFFTTKGFGKGYGMGLSSVYGIIQQNRGTISVEGQPSKGAVFTFAIPRASRPMKPEEEAVPMTMLAEARERIMVVEDETGILRLIQQILQRKGYQVDAFHQPREALAFFEKDPTAVDMVVSDVLMPVMSGPQMVSAMRRSRPTLKAIFITGHMDGIVVSEELENLGTVVPKPFDAATLQAAIYRALKG